MAKDNERLVAKQLFFQGKSQKDISIMINVQEKTVNTWCRKYNWKEERIARVNGNKGRIEGLKNLIGKLTEKRLQLMNEMEKEENEADTQKASELYKRANQIADEISKYNKALENLDSENKISLSTYLEVMDGIFKDIEHEHPQIYMQLLDFQEKHISTIVKKY